MNSPGTEETDPPEGVSPIAPLAPPMIPAGDLKGNVCRVALANLIRMHEKKWFGRGPVEVSVEVVDSTILMRCKSVLAKHESALIGGRTDRDLLGALQDFRAACFARSKDSLARNLTGLLGIPVLEIGYCLFVRTNESVYVVRTLSERPKISE
jgi:uncharacterized protein YbcI